MQPVGKICSIIRPTRPTKLPACRKVLNSLGLPRLKAELSTKLRIKIIKKFSAIIGTDLPSLRHQTREMVTSEYSLLVVLVSVRQNENFRKNCTNIFFFVKSPYSLCFRENFYEIMKNLAKTSKGATLLSYTYFCENFRGNKYFQEKFCDNK